MELPSDLNIFIQHTFAPEDWTQAISVLEGARIETGEAPSARLLRCAAFASRGNLQRLQHYTSMLAIDWRDVVVAGEYESQGGMPVCVRDLSQPLQV